MFTTDEKNVLRALELHGGITAAVASRHGWLSEHGVPVGPLRSLTDKRVVAPRVLTSYPLTVVWQLRKDHSTAHVLSQIERETRRQNIKEYAAGGFQLHTRKDIDVNKIR